MKYRRLDQNGDYVFGQGSNNFIQNTPETVGQAVITRLLLIQGEWFLDNTRGTPYNSQVLGMGKIQSYDYAIQQVIIGTPGVVSIASYSSGLDASTRKATINATINTLYGTTTVQTVL